MFESGIIIVVEIVDADDLLATIQQRHGNVGSDEAGGTGNEQSHAHLLADSFAPCEGLCTDATAAKLHGRDQERQE
jgi:hypothetical protein